MKQALMDKAISKVTKNKVNTVRVTREEMADMIDRYFIQKVETREECGEIWKVVKRGVLFDKIYISKDGNYELRSKSSQGGGSLKKFIWVYDKAENTFYEYNYWFGFYGKFKRMMRNKLIRAGM